MAKCDQVKDFVNKKIGIFSDDQYNKAALPRLRDGIMFKPGKLPYVMSIVLTDMDPSLCGSNGISPAEIAAYSALTLWATHQQGLDIKSFPMHKKDDPQKDGPSVGRAAARLCLAMVDDGKSLSDAKEDAGKKLDALCMSNNADMLFQSLRKFVFFLNKYEVPMDYALLARDIYLYCFRDNISDIKIRWLRDFNKALAPYTNPCYANPCYANP